MEKASLVAVTKPLSFSLPYCVCPVKVNIFKNEHFIVFNMNYNLLVHNKRTKTSKFTFEMKLIFYINRKNMPIELLKIKKS